MIVNPNIFRGYDLRGLVGVDLNPEIAEHLGRAHGSLLKTLGVNKAVVGRDCRATSQDYSEAIARGLNWAGIDTFDIGLTLVGTFYWSQYYLHCQGGVYVTASHNPAEYNGFKFANGFSETLVSEGMQELRTRVSAENYLKGKTSGKNSVIAIQEAYFSDLLEKIPVTKKFKVVIDPGNSTAGAIAPDLLRRAGCEVIESNCEIDPSFPLGTPDPTETAVAERVKKAVLASKADLGFSFDADGDRIGIVDEQGGIIWNDILLCLFAVDVLSVHPGATIMYNALCSRAVEETILYHGGKPYMWRVGHSFLKKKNQEVKAAFIGELSGHFFFSADFYNHDDGLYSAMRLLGFLSRTGQTLSEAIASLPKYLSSPEIKLYCPDDKKAELIKKLSPILKNDFPQAEVIDDERAGDGLRMNLSDSMFVIRYSQNGPYITVKFEAKEQKKYEDLKKYISNLLHGFPEINWGEKNVVNKEALA